MKCNGIQSLIHRNASVLVFSSDNCTMVMQDADVQKTRLGIHNSSLYCICSSFMNPKFSKMKSIFFN